MSDVNDNPTDATRLADPVAPDQVESRLNALWEQLAGQSDQSVLRACMSNLVVLCPPDGDAGRIAEAVAGLADAHPSRCIVLRWTDGGGKVEATVSAHCAGGAGRHVCCEQITLTGGTGRLADLGSAALPLLLPDLPVVLWATNGLTPPADPLADLMAQVDRVLVDTRRSDRPAQAWSVCHRAPGGHTLHCAVSDLSWSRLAPLRDRFASMFDPPELADLLADARGVRLEWTAHPSDRAAGRASALLTLGWLADRLGWSLKATRPGPDADARLSLENPAGQPIETALAAVAPSADVPLGRLVRVALTTGAAAFELRRTAISRLELSIARAGSPPRVEAAAHRHLRTGDLLLAELSGAGDEESFQRALAVALPAAIDLE
ncbi:MAG: hypothetical protein BIFFINMI_04077 [Phycisphaerae bacterium]|nr:hypothetical protein [Phycisphaerae bacterium]